MNRLQRFRKLHEMGCIICGNPPDIHHRVSGSRRMGDRFTIPLCPWHHRGVPVGSLTRHDCLRIFGPSMAISRRSFEARWGTEEALWRQTEDRLNASPKGLYAQTDQG